MTTLASWGEQLARALLREPLPRRWVFGTRKPAAEPGEDEIEQAQGHS
jgi:hypothetical protein